MAEREDRVRVSVTLDADDGLEAVQTAAALLPRPWGWLLRSVAYAAAQAAQELPAGAHWVGQIGPLRIRLLAPDGRPGGSGVGLW